MLRQMTRLAFLVAMFGIASGGYVFAENAQVVLDDVLGDPSAPQIRPDGAVLEGVPALQESVDAFGGYLPAYVENNQLSSQTAIFGAASEYVEESTSDSGSSVFDNNGNVVHNVTSGTIVLSASDAYARQVYGENTTRDTSCVNKTLRPGVLNGCVDVNRRCDNGTVTVLVNHKLRCDSGSCTSPAGLTIQNATPNTEECGPNNWRNNKNKCVQQNCACKSGFYPSQGTCFEIKQSSSDIEANCFGTYHSEGLDKQWVYSEHEYMRGGWSSEHCECVVKDNVENPTYCDDRYYDYAYGPDGTVKCKSKTDDDVELVEPTCKPDWTVRDDGTCLSPASGKWVATPDGVGGLRCDIPFSRPDATCAKRVEDGNITNVTDDARVLGGCFCTAKGEYGKPDVGPECKSRCLPYQVVSDDGMDCNDPCWNIKMYNDYVDPCMLDRGVDCEPQSYTSTVAIVSPECTEENLYEPGKAGGCLGLYCKCRSASDNVDYLEFWDSENDDPNQTLDTVYYAGVGKDGQGNDKLLYPWYPQNGVPQCVSRSHDCSEFAYDSKNWPESVVPYVDNDPSYIPEGHEYGGALGEVRGQISEYCHCADKDHDGAAQDYMPWIGLDASGTGERKLRCVPSGNFGEPMPNSVIDLEHCSGGRSKPSDAAEEGGCICDAYTGTSFKDNGLCVYRCGKKENDTFIPYYVSGDKYSCVTEQPNCDGIANIKDGFSSCSKASSVGTMGGCPKAWCRCKDGYEVNYIDGNGTLGCVNPCEGIDNSEPVNSCFDGGRNWSETNDKLIQCVALHCKCEEGYASVGVVGNDPETKKGTCFNKSLCTGGATFDISCNEDSYQSGDVCASQYCKCSDGFVTNESGECVEPAQGETGGGAGDGE